MNKERTSHEGGGLAGSSWPPVNSCCRTRTFLKGRQIKDQTAVVQFCARG